MIMINLLPWRENLRRKRRRKMLLGIGIALGVIMGFALIGRCYIVNQLNNAERKLADFNAELTKLKKEFEIRDLQWVSQKKILALWEEQKGWRKKFLCQQAWLNDLAHQLPQLCRVEKTEVNSDRWQLVVLCEQEVELQGLTQSIFALPGMSQIKLSQLELDEKKEKMRVEFNAVLNCD